MGTRVVAVQNAPSVSRSIPTTGMRGGLGRILLTAFLILTILPLALIGGYAAQNNRENLQQAVQSKLQAVATLKGEELRQWLERIQRLQPPVSPDGTIARAELDHWWLRTRAQEPDLIGGFLVDASGRQLWTKNACRADSMQDTADSVRTPDSFAADVNNQTYVSSGRLFLSPVDANNWLFVNRGEDYTLGFCFHQEAIERMIRYDMLQEEALIGETGRVYLVSESRIWSGGDEAVTAASLDVALERLSDGLYVNHQGVQVIGAHAYLADFDVGVLVEQTRAETLASTDRVAATLIALVLTVALATTAIAAVVIRQITRPVIRLTESAVAMAEGDLDQHLSVTSRDEIGILTYVFNEMAADLKSLYEDLEAKVAERTQRLQQANYQIQRRALHLQASQDVGQAITSVRDPLTLLNRVVDLIRDQFVYTAVAIYIVEPGGGEIRLRALSPAEREQPDGAQPSRWVARVYAGDGSIVERAVRKRASQVDHQQTDEAVEWYRRTLSRVAIPLRVGEQVLGVIGVLSIEREGIQEDELEVLELLAGQVAIAMDNAKAYERERLVAQHMEEAEVFKARFLANMSHELREPLNTIIGFSRLMIKGIDGPMTSQQTQDLERIYDDSQRLLFLINDILVISQLQAGMVEMKFQPVHLADVVNGVMPTASALVRGKEIELVQDVPDNLPVVRADPTRLRQVLLHLLNNAAKFTESGQIVIKAWCNEDQIYVSVSDTGAGIPPEDRERIFYRFDKGQERTGRWQEGAGLGLALSKEFVEMHGGQIWVNSEVNKGSTFTFSLQCHTETDNGSQV